MIRNKKTYLISIVLNILYLVVLTIITDPFKKNYSMLSSSFSGHLLIIGLCVLLSLNISNVTYLLNRKYLLISLIGPLVAAVFPYVENSGDLFSGLHEICAYVSFAIVNIITIINIYKYSFIDRKKGKILFTAYFITVFIDVIMFLETMGAVAIEQLLLLSVILIIHVLMFIGIRSENT